MGTCLTCLIPLHSRAVRDCCFLNKSPAPLCLATSSLPILFCGFRNDPCQSITPASRKRYTLNQNLLVGNGLPLVDLARLCCHKFHRLADLGLTQIHCATFRWHITGITLIACYGVLNHDCFALRNTGFPRNFIT